jgi:hypothetical protein
VVETAQEIVGLVVSGQTPFNKDLDVLLADGVELAAQSDPQALPMLLQVIWQQSKSEDLAKTYQAIALYAIRMSPVWHKYASTVGEGDLSRPSWRSFVRDYLPCKYQTVVERTNVIETFRTKLQWPVEKIAEVGFSKLQTARHTVEAEIEETGDILPETQRILEEETHENLLTHVAGKTPKIGFSYQVTSGEFFVHFPSDICPDTAMAHVLTLEPTPDGVSNDLWSTVLGLIVERMRATMED